MHAELSVLLLFAVASLVALVVRWLRIPYTVALVLAGLGLGAAQLFEPPRLTKELLYGVFLPGLVFEAAFHLEFKRYAQNKIAIHSLAVPGVVLGIGLTAVLLTPVANALHLVERFSLGHGLILGAVLAATDPIAVVALFRQLGVPRRLAVLVEGESLLNDGTGVVLFTMILQAVSTQQMHFGSAALEFVQVVGLGLVVGAVIALAISRLVQLIDDPMIEITLTTLAAWGSFLVAEQLHASGVIATVAAGMICGNYAASTGMTPTTRIAVASFWEYIAFALNSVVFLLIGFQVRIESLLASWKQIAVAYLAVTISRAVVVAVVTTLLRPSREQIPWSWAPILTWGGLRGALSMVLVLGLAPAFPHRDLLVTMTFGVVIVSILVQGFTMSPLIRRLGIAAGRDASSRHAAARAEVNAVRAALDALRRIPRSPEVTDEVLQGIEKEYRERLEHAETHAAALRPQATEAGDEERRAIRRQLILAEKNALLEEERRGAARSEILQPMISQLDARLLELDGDRDTG